MIRNAIKGFKEEGSLYNNQANKMEAISPASHLFHCHSSLTKYTITNRRIDMPCSCLKFQRTLPIRAQVAFMDTTVIFAIDSPSSFRGDVSVLVSVTAVLLFVYWIANFVVPGFINKDFVEPEASDRENIKD
ncbi:hypothetical protein M5K25_019506 [Dendrobium thyrsiflorum]|uniref:Uncharacterized protein n=1 Tax=Dendrobium thyrsiflorum TaxID=117978 RepID=A0ABD0UF81_DENTH